MIKSYHGVLFREMENTQDHNSDLNGSLPSKNYKEHFLKMSDSYYTSTCGKVSEIKDRMTFL